MRKVLLKGVLPLAIVLAGAAVYALLVGLSEPPRREEQPYRGPLVETMRADPRAVEVVVEGQGTVQPGAQIDLVPRVAGTVVWKSPQLERGGFFHQGDLLVQIESEDYELAEARMEAEVAQARYRLDLASREADVARREWELLNPGSGAGPAPDPLVLHVPQMRAARAALAAAEARLAEARLQLARTRLLAPFDGRVRDTSFDAGQFVTPGRSVAQLYSIEKAEIVVPVADKDLAWFDLLRLQQVELAGEAVRNKASPMVNGPAEGGRQYSASGPGPEAVVRGWYAGRRHRWSGRVVRAEGELDPRSRMAHLVVEVDDPYGARETPLVAGLFVDVAIAGSRVEGVRVVPRHVLRPDNTVWTVGEEGVLRVRRAQLVHSRKDEVLIRVDMLPDERIVVSQLSAVTDGMKVRVAEGTER